MSKVIQFPPRQPNDVPSYLESVAKRLRDNPDDEMRFIFIMEDAGSLTSSAINYTDRMAAIGVLEAIKVGLVFDVVEADD